MRAFLTVCLAACSLSPFAASYATDIGNVKAIIGGALVDLEGAQPSREVVIVITGERITAIGARGEVTVPENAELFDATGMWLVPGLVNVHAHFGLVFPGKNSADLAHETEGELTLRMAKAAREALEAGVTTVRSPGEQRHGDLSLRKAISLGQVDGPRIFSAGEALIISGGHGSQSGVAHLDGPYELMKAARKEISAGASWVKILISGGIATDTGGVGDALMTPEEINAVVDVAHRLGAKVAAHSGSSVATNIAVDAGVDSIEHGYFLDRSALKNMKDHGTWLVPTIVVTQPATRPYYEAMGVPQWFLERFESVGDAHWKVLEMAIEEGVSIALGTDQLPSEPNDGTIATVREAEYYVQAGMTPLQALRAATVGPAKMLDAEDEIGILEDGKYADIVAVPKDPTHDITALRDIKFVMKGGEIYRNQL